MFQVVTSSLTADLMFQVVTIAAKLQKYDVSGGDMQLNCIYDVSGGDKQLNCRYDV